MTHEFVVHCTPDSGFDNPLPKLKMTGGQTWTKKAIKYGRWKTHVSDSFLCSLVDQYGIIPDGLRGIVTPLAKQKPLTTPPGHKSRMEIVIHWGKSRKRADPENVFGSIADALFSDDSLLAGSFDFDESDDGRGKVFVRLTL